MLWALENPTRFLTERTALEALAGEVEWLQSVNWRLTKEGLLQVDAKLAADRESFEVELVYPRLFPETPAFVRPRHGVTERWSSHQYGPGGVLCLEWGPDTWRPEITGADLLRSTYKLLSTERASGASPREVPSRHALTVGQDLRSSVRRLIVNPALAAFIKGLGNHTSCRLRTRRIYHDRCLVFFITDVIHGEGDTFANTDVPQGISESTELFAWESSGWLLKCTSLPSSGTFTNYTELLSAIHAAGFTDFAFPTLDSKAVTDFLVVLVEAEKGSRAFTAAVHGDGTVKECSILDTVVNDTFSRIPGDERDYWSKRVGIVGLGSVGSKIAVSLARHGVKRFLLVDDDIMLPGNVCRHELHWSSVGASKVEALKERLSLIAPNIEISYRQARIAGQESSESAATAADALAACDLLIDATANPTVFLLLAAIAKRRSLPLVWGELFAGGIGALLARSRPGRDPDPLTARAAFHHYLESLPPAPFAHAREYDVTADEQPVIASDADVSQLAAIMTRLIIDSLNDVGTPEFLNSLYLVGFKKAWIFDAPFDTRPLIFDVPPTVPEASADPETKAKVVSDLIELARRQTDGDPSPSI